MLVANYTYQTAGLNQAAMLDKLSDNELVTRTLSGDKQAYRTLVERYQQKGYAVAYEITRSREDAEDVLQEAFVKAYLALPTFRGQSTFYTWFYRIVSNMAIDLKRRGQRRGGEKVVYDEVNFSAVAAEDTGLANARVAGPYEAVERKEQLQTIQKILDELSPEHRQVIMMREVEGMSYEEIAESLEISKGTVMSRLFYARKKLQHGLAENGSGATSL